jgi:hypothetical protein
MFGRLLLTIQFEALTAWFRSGLQGFIFKPKIPIWVHFGVAGMEYVFIFYDHLEYFMAIWYT